MNKAIKSNTAGRNIRKGYYLKGKHVRETFKVADQKKERANISIKIWIDLKFLLT